MRGEERERGEIFRADGRQGLAGKNKQSRMAHRVHRFPFSRLIVGR